MSTNIDPVTGCTALCIITKYSFIFLKSTQKVPLENGGKPLTSLSEKIARVCSSVAESHTKKIIEQKATW